MTDTRDINPNMRAHFMQKATLPKRDVAAANMFLAHLEGGHVHTPQEAVTGQKLLHTLEAKTELYEFYAAVRAGQEAKDESDIERRVTAIAKAVEPAEQTTEKLRKVLETVT